MAWFDDLGLGVLLSGCLWFVVLITGCGLWLGFVFCVILRLLWVWSLCFWFVGFALRWFVLDLRCGLFVGGLCSFGNCLLLCLCDRLWCWGVAIVAFGG